MELGIQGALYQNAAKDATPSFFPLTPYMYPLRGMVEEYFVFHVPSGRVVHVFPNDDHIT